MKRCVHCGKENREEARFCGHCGKPFTSDPPRQTVSEHGTRRQVPSRRLATVLSFIWPGFGQLYKGEVPKAIAFALVFLIFSIVLDSHLWFGVFLQPSVSFLVLTGLVAFVIYNIIDARKVTEGKPWRDFSPTMKVLSLSAVGISVVGVLGPPFLSHEVTARQQLEEMHIPYTEEALVGEAEGGNVETLKLLLAAGMNPNGEHPIFGPALLVAAEKGHTEIVQLLLANGADVNATDLLGRTALMRAAENGHTAIVKALIDKGAYVNAKHHLGGTALSGVNSSRHADIVQLLKQAGARE